MKHFIVSSLIIACVMNSIMAQPGRILPFDSKITIEAEIPPGFNKKWVSLKGYPLPLITTVSDKEFTYEHEVKNGKLNWEFPGATPIAVAGEFIYGPRGILNYLLEPGDNIEIQYPKEGKPLFFGEGAAKLELTNTLSYILDSLYRSPSYRALSRKHEFSSSVQDYLQWNDFLDLQLRLTLPIIELYKNKISGYAADYIKEKVVSYIECRRLDKYMGIITKSSYRSNHPDSIQTNKWGLTNEDLCAIYDTTLNNEAASWLQYETKVVGNGYYYFHRSFLDVCRQKKMFFTLNASDTPVVGKERADRYVNRYFLVKKKYKGIIREAALSFFFHYPSGVLKRVGFDPKIESILADYYASSSLPSYAQEVKESEVKMREKKNGITDFSFTLTDPNGMEVEKNVFNGKVALFDFWFTGCAGCIQMTPVLKEIENKFKNNPDVQFINVSVDKDQNQWKNSLGHQKYTTASGVSLYTSGKGINHPLIKNYLISSFPSLLLFNPYGKSIPDKHLTDPRTDNGKALTELIEKQIRLMKDGPYVFIEKDSLSINYINGSQLSKYFVKKDSDLQLNTESDPVLRIPIQWKKDIQSNPSVFPTPSKMLVLSDIEGNFDALKELLITNKVISDTYEWTFGEGHLVFIGDMFDRGEQVTECLWLMYSLEQKAKDKGGYVHYILGNHEIMNLQANNRYTQTKYKKNASLMNMSMNDIYSEYSILGKWLRTKNIIEKIGNILFLHGGISEGITKSGLSIGEINNLARPYYSNYNPSSSPGRINLIMNDKNGIFWNRNYYTLDSSQIHTLLKKTIRTFSVDHIVTGHTLVKSITSFFNGILINTDTHHAEGKSEALWIDKSGFYRVDNKGNKKPLIVSD